MCANSTSPPSFCYIHPSGNSGFDLKIPPLLSPALQALDLWKFTDLATQSIFLLLYSFYTRAELPLLFLVSSCAFLADSLLLAGLAVCQLLSGLPRGQFDGIQCL